MRLTKGLLFMITVLVSAFFLIACDKPSTKVVREVPSGYINLKEETDNLQNGLYYVFWETQLSFVSADDICIYQTGIDNSEFIVSYENIYYVNKEKYLEIVSLANDIFEEHSNIYSLGECIRLYGTEDEPYEVLINDVNTSINDDAEISISTIQFSISSNMPEDKMTDIFDHIVTSKNMIVTEFKFSHEGTVEVNIPNDEKIQLIILKSPDYIDCTRTLSLE